MPEGKTLFSTPPLFLCEVFYFCMFGMIILLYIIQNLSYQHNAFSFFPLHLIYLLSEGPIIIKKKRKSNQRMATVFSIRLSCVWVFTAHTLGCMLETLLSCPRDYKLSYHALASQLLRQFVDSPSLEVFKNRTKYPSVQNGFDVVPLIRRNRLGCSVRVRFYLECS